MYVALLMLFGCRDWQLTNNKPQNIDTDAFLGAGSLQTLRVMFNCDYIVFLRGLCFR